MFYVNLLKINYSKLKFIFSISFSSLIKFSISSIVEFTSTVGVTPGVTWTCVGVGVCVLAVVVTSVSAVSFCAHPSSPTVRKKY